MFVKYKIKVGIASFANHENLDTPSSKAGVFKECGISYALADSLHTDPLTNFDYMNLVAVISNSVNSLFGKIRYHLAKTDRKVGSRCLTTPHTHVVLD
jgi:hypothetical protein